MADVTNVTNVASGTPPMHLAAMFAMAGLLATRDYEPDDPELAEDAFKAARTLARYLDKEA